MNEGPFGKWVISCIYSDDGGKSWKLGQPTANMKGMVNDREFFLTLSTTNPYS